MPVATLTGEDTVIIDNRVFNDFGDGDVFSITYPNELMNIKTGKNGNSLYAFNNSGKQCDVSIRVMRGSADDKWLLAKFNQNERDPIGQVLMACEAVKRLGDGKGNIASDTYVLSGGVFTKNLDMKDNADGDTDQAIAEYTLKFTNSDRGIL